nr:F-box domain, leucine-rich repeat domain, L domain-like protein [Tanacetum cinerariifolium]
MNAQRQTKAQFGRQGSGQAEYPRKIRNLSLKEITDTKGPVPIQFELRDKQTVMPLGDHAAHWSSYIAEVIRGVPLYYPSWLKVPNERKAALITDIGTQFDLMPHMKFPDWTEINAGIQQHLQKAYNTNKAAFKAHHWVIDPTTGTYNVEKIRRERPENITASEWDKYIEFWNDPRNIARGGRGGGRGCMYRCRPQPLRSTRRSLTHSSWHTLLTGNFFGMRTDEMRRLEAMGTYTDDEINRLARGGKQRGHIIGVGRVLLAWATASPNMFSQFDSGGSSGSGGCGDDEEGADHQDDEDEDGDDDT